MSKQRISLMARAYGTGCSHYALRANCALPLAQGPAPALVAVVTGSAPWLRARDRGDFARSAYAGGPVTAQPARAIRLVLCSPVHAIRLLLFFEWQNRPYAVFRSH